MSNLIIMRGPSCVGKTSFINKHYGLNNPAVLSSDKFREILCGDKSCQDHNQKIFETLHMICDHRLAHNVDCTIIDATNLTIKDCAKFLYIALEHESNIQVISIDPPDLEELKRRNERRFRETGFHIPHHILERHINKYYNHLGDFERFAKINASFENYYTLNRLSWDKL